MDREQFDHYLHDEARRGPAPDDAFTGAAGGAGCGDLSRISLSVEDGLIAAVSFDAEGCGSTIAATRASGPWRSTRRSAVSLPPSCTPPDSPATPCIGP
jgi:NifU-like protein involved in Fe-S cluster formation